MNCFHAAGILTTQGADKNNMALVLESLTDGNLLPREGETGAEITTRDVVSIILGATSAQPENAAKHCISVAGLIRSDGQSFGENLTKIMGKKPQDIQVEEITISAAGNVATIRRPDGALELFYTSDGLKPFRHACIVRGSLLQALAIKMQMPTVSGWTENPTPE